MPEEQPVTSHVSCPVIVMFLFLGCFPVVDGLMNIIRGSIINGIIKGMYVDNLFDEVVESGKIRSA